MANSAYQPYISALREVLKESSFQKGFEKGYTESRNFSAEEVQAKRHQDIIQNLETQPNIQSLATILGLPVRAPRTGDHPDFAHIRQTGKYERHYIVSMFMDVKNSTALFRRYDEETVNAAIQIIVLAALQTCALFGGHIQRMQYDGVFTYFGGKNISKASAVLNAINAASFFSYFVKYELVQVLDEIGMERLSARTGIDFGDADKTLWGVFGMGACTELTTTSLHTSLSPKMQSCAPSNGIMVGENVRDLLGQDGLLCDTLKDNKTGNVDENKRRIFNDPDYRQYCFDWETFLLTKYKTFIRRVNGKLVIDYELALPANREKENELMRKLGLVSSLGSIDAHGRVSEKPSRIPTPANRNYSSDR